MPFQPKTLCCEQCIKAHLLLLVTCMLWSVSTLVGDVTHMAESSSEILLCAYDKHLSSAHFSTRTIRLRAPAAVQHGSHSCRIQTYLHALLYLGKPPDSSQMKRILSPGLMGPIDRFSITILLSLSSVFLVS